jgi:hypothetical protein
MVTSNKQRNHWMHTVTKGIMVMKETKVTNLMDLENVNMVEHEFRMPRCKEHMWKLCALQSGLQLSNVVSQCFIKLQ